MSEPDTTESVIAALQRSTSSSWLTWFMPAAAVLIAAWLLWQALPDQGPQITVIAEDAEGLEAGRTGVFYRGVRIGQIDSITLASGLDAVLLAVSLDENMDAFASEGASYAVVKPQLRVGQLSGLRTLVSGRYLDAAPGNGKRQQEFVAAPQSPLPGSTPLDLRIILNADNAGSLVRGSAVRYRDLTIGQLESVALGDTAGQIEIVARISPAYHHLIRRNNVFWAHSGVNVELGLFKGFELDTDSLQNLLTGAVDMAIPEEFGPPAEAGWRFRLAQKPRPEWRRWKPALENPPNSPAGR